MYRDRVCRPQVVHAVETHETSPSNRNPKFETPGSQRWLSAVAVKETELVEGSESSVCSIESSRDRKAERKKCLDSMREPMSKCHQRSACPISQRVWRLAGRCLSGWQPAGLAVSNPLSDSVVALALPLPSTGNPPVLLGAMVVWQGRPSWPESAFPRVPGPSPCALE